MSFAMTCGASVRVPLACMHPYCSSLWEYNYNPTLAMPNLPSINQCVKIL